MKHQYCKFTPSDNPELESTYIRAGETWEKTLQMTEIILENEFFKKPWNKVKLTIECVDLTDDEYKNLTGWRNEKEKS